MIALDDKMETFQRQTLDEINTLSKIASLHN